ncbi:Dual oxidase, partial [Araneus ventricosus]
MCREKWRYQGGGGRQNYLMNSCVPFLPSRPFPTTRSLPLSLLVLLMLQNIILYEYVPAFLEEEITPYSGYKPDVHPGISHVFQSAAFRFAHTMIPPGLYRRDGKCNFKTTPSGYPAIRLCSTWWNSEEILIESGVEELLMGMASQISEREDAVLCSDVR